MAQLPDEDMIALPQPGSRRPVSTADVSGYARGAAALDSGVETFGKGITSAANDLAAVLKSQREADDRRGYARAKAAINAALINHGNAIEKETNPVGLPEKVRTRVGEDAEIASREIKDLRTRERFRRAAEQQGAWLISAAATRALHLAREASKADDIATLNALSEGAVHSSDPNAVRMVVQSASDVIDGWGWIDRREADTAKALFAQDFAVRKFNALPLAERHAAFGGGRYAELVAAMPADSRERARIGMEREVAQARVKASHDAFSATQQALAAAADRLVPLPSWESIADNPHLQPADMSRARALYDAAAADAASLRRFMIRFHDDNDARPFDPQSAEDRKNADKAFALLGGDTVALEAVVTRARILPKRAGVALRGAMMSDDPKRVADALTIASNLYIADPNVFIGVDGQSEFESNGTAFRHYVDMRGMSAAEAAARIIRNRSPDYQANVQARLKTEDVERKLGRQLSAADLAGEFGQVSWTEPFDPKVGLDPAMHRELFEHYTDLVKDRYLETGDFALAKVQAADQLKRVWGVTRVSGSQIVMPYPPERAPAYAGIEDAADLIAAQAVETIKARTGQDVPRSSIRLLPIPGITAAQYKSGHTPQYLLMWTDKRGNRQMLLEGKAFEAPPGVLRAAQVKQRGADLTRKASIARAVDDTARDPRTPFGVDFPAIRGERRR